ncbi:hypothetical protein BDV96DRAFT_605556 [Lophiotrema nucula]|uniref:AB hydrolase-1 domain-containing protein n=1 Tax=Lophiotrema nucula TaxID=690887 RepID=A0A6A5YQS7_9PLEO|nr:hypothetical protein BDV96DRAFT_605556 [Lophiotrema nucula]
MSASSSASMHALMQKLAALGYTCYAPDRPGFGASDDPDIEPPSIAWYAELYHASFSLLPGFEHGCHILGHDSGGIIGTELANAERYGGFARSLTCIGPTVMSAEQRLEMSKTFLEPINKPVPSGG